MNYTFKILLCNCDVSSTLYLFVLCLQFFTKFYMESYSFKYTYFIQ